MKYIARADHFPILDALRAILALTVALGHLGMPPVFGSVAKGDSIFRDLARLWRTFAFGPPAVIAFFLISGFCIHFAFADPARKFPVVRFYARRYLRILVPVLAVIVLLWGFRSDISLVGKHSILWNSTLWSVLCEETYYAVYPLILIAGRRFGVRVVFLASLPPSIAVIAFTFPAVEWTTIGIIGTTIVLFPVWLLGVLLAEEVWRGAISVASRRAIGLWRLGAWCVMWFALVAHFHSAFHQTISCLPVGAYAFFWLRAEIGRAAASRPPAFIVSMGAGSYSLYLVHPLIIDGFRRPDVFASLSPRVDWTLAMALILAGALVFYLLIEAPSHRLARRISLREKPQATPVAARIA